MTPIRAKWPLALLGMLFVLGIVAMAYWPGLSGSFLFDDYINLDALGRYGGVRDFDTFLYYLTSGTADPTGRPIAQFSFLLDATNWPADPWPFKRTNLAIHLLNGGLLFLLLGRLQRWLPGGRQSGGTGLIVPLLGATLWVAHPLWVSTTLYVIQRQAMLAAMFVLLGLLAWDRGYERLRTGENAKAWLWISLGVGGATLLAGLSKANGFLLPILALTIWAVLQLPHDVELSAQERRGLKWHVAAWLGMPIAIFLGYLAWQVPSAIRSADAIREWTLGERLLSQPRALWDYLGLLAAPREGSGGIFTDGFHASHGMLDPWSTLPALVALLGLCWFAIATRRRWPRLSVALLFFLGGHLLESGPVPLELYFEHRNYLPSILLGWPLAHAMLSPGPILRGRLALAIAIPVFWLALTWQRATVWGNPPLQAALWAERNPDSPRAQGYAASWLQRHGRAQEAHILLVRSEAHAPGHAMIALNRIAEGCASGDLNKPAISAAENATRILRSWNQGTVDWFEKMQVAVLAGKCPALGSAGWKRLSVALGQNPAFTRAPIRQQVLVRMQGREALAQGRPEMALQVFNHGLELDPRPELALAQAADLGNAGYPSLALRHLDRFREMGVDPAPGRIHDMHTLHRWVLTRTGYYRRELRILREALERDSLR